VEWVPQRMDRSMASDVAWLDAGWGHCREVACGEWTTR
jgi:hypothetical protein